MANCRLLADCRPLTAYCRLPTTDNGQQTLQVPPKRLEQPGTECEAAPEGGQRQQTGAGCQCDRQAPLSPACLLDPRLEAIERNIAAEERYGADDHHHQWENDR